jgi:hypothetical protein
MRLKVLHDQQQGHNKAAYRIQTEMDITRRSFIKTGAIGLAAAKIARSVSAAENDKSSPGEA